MQFGLIFMAPWALYLVAAVKKQLQSEWRPWAEESLGPWNLWLSPAIWVFTSPPDSSEAPDVLESPLRSTVSFKKEAES